MWHVTGFGQSEFSCLKCIQHPRGSHVPRDVLELIDGSREVAIRLAVRRSRLRDNGDKRFPNPHRCAINHAAGRIGRVISTGEARREL